jgi:hypothetical protein
MYEKYMLRKKKQTREAAESRPANASDTGSDSGSDGGHKFEDPAMTALQRQVKAQECLRLAAELLSGVEVELGEEEAASSEKGFVFELGEDDAASSETPSYSELDYLRPPPPPPPPPRHQSPVKAGALDQELSIPVFSSSPGQGQLQTRTSQSEPRTFGAVSKAFTFTASDRIVDETRSGSPHGSPLQYRTQS